MPVVVFQLVLVVTVGYVVWTQILSPTINGRPWFPALRSDEGEVTAELYQVNDDLEVQALRQEIREKREALAKQNDAPTQTEVCPAEATTAEVTPAEVSSTRWAGQTEEVTPTKRVRKVSSKRSAVTAVKTTKPMPKTAKPTKAKRPA